MNKTSILFQKIPYLENFFKVSLAICSLVLMLGVLLLYAKDRYQLFLDAPVVEHLLTTWTFDAVSDSYRVEGFFELRNTTSTELELDGAYSDCGCLTTPDLVGIVPAGESKLFATEIKVPLDSLEGRMDFDVVSKDRRLPVRWKLAMASDYIYASVRVNP